MCSKTESSVKLWSWEGVPSANVVSLPRMWYFSAHWTVACSTICTAADWVSEKWFFCLSALAAEGWLCFMLGVRALRFPLFMVYFFFLRGLIVLRGDDSTLLLWNRGRTSYWKGRLSQWQYDWERGMAVSCVNYVLCTGVLSVNMNGHVVSRFCTIETVIEQFSIVKGKFC